MDDNASSDDIAFLDAEMMDYIIQEELEADEAMMDTMYDSSSSDEEEMKSRKGKAPNKKRDFVLGYTKVVNDYFNGRDSVYDEADFETRFRMPRELFNRIHDELMGLDPFVHYEDATGLMGIYPLVKLTATLRYLAYGDAFDREDEDERCFSPWHCEGLLTHD